MNPLRALAEHLADRIHAPGDVNLRNQGFTVERLPGGRRRISDPRLPGLLDQRRLRAMQAGLDSIDRALLDATTAELYAATAQRAGIAIPDRIASRCRHYTAADHGLDGT